MSSGKKKGIRYIFILGFAVSSILPLLFFLYILLDRGLIDYTRAGIFLLFGLFLAVLGFFFLRGAIGKFTRLSRDLAAASDGEGMAMLDPKLLGEVEEVDSILEAFNSLANQIEELKQTKADVARVKKLRVELDRLNRQLISLEEISRIIESGWEAEETISGSLGKIVEAVRGSWVVVLPDPGKDVLDKMFISGEPESARELQPVLDKITAQVAGEGKAYLKGNVPKPRVLGSEFPGPFVSLPLSFGGNAAAALHLGRYGDLPPFTGGDIRFARVAMGLMGRPLYELARARAQPKPPPPRKAPEAEPAPGPPPREATPPEPLVQPESATPRPEPPPEEPEAAPAEPETPPRPASNTVMVVDDEPSVRSVLTEFLKEKGFRVVTAAEGSEALSLLRSEVPQLLLLDIKMPGMDGMEFLRIIHNEFRELPVVMITSETEDRVFKEAIAMGAYDYVVKPIDFKYLENVLRYKLPDI